MDQQLQTAITDLNSGSFNIPQKCAICRSQDDLIDRTLSHSTSSSYTSGNTTTTTTTTNSLKVKLCGSCKKKLDKAISVTGGWRLVLTLIEAAACGIVAYASLGNSPDPIEAVLAVGIAAILGGGILFFLTVNWMIPSESRVTKKRLGRLSRADFDFTKPGEQESCMKGVFVPVFANPEFQADFDEANPSVKYMKSISRKIRYK